MKKNVRSYLDDIIESCGKIETYISDVNKPEFEDDPVLQDAVIRTS